MTIELNKDQVAALAALQAFLADDNLDAFILRGGAGTGKTTLIGKLVEEWTCPHLIPHPVLI